MSTSICLYYRQCQKLLAEGNIAFAISLSSPHKVIRKQQTTDSFPDGGIDV